MTKKNSVNKDGFVLNEKTQALDMKAIYDAIDGSTILFDIDDKTDQKAPYIDNLGIIHMPKSCQSAELEQTTLRTVFFNISVQGNTQNQGMQRVINDTALSKLSQFKANQRNPMQALQLRQVFEQHSKSKSEDSFEVALKTAMTISKSSGYISTNCYGGKDRTGYLLALITKRVLQSHLEEKMHGKTKEVKGLMKHWNHALIGRESIAAGIVKDNAGHNILKLQRFDLELFDVSTFQGLTRRVDAYGRAAFLYASGKQVSYSDTPGQIYKIGEEAS